MARTIWDGFDSYADISGTIGVASKWAIISGASGSLTLQTGRFSGGRCVRLASSSGSPITSMAIQRAFGPAGADFAFAFAIRRPVTGYTPSAAGIIIADSSGARHLLLQLMADMSIRVLRLATGLAVATTLGITPANLTPADAWVHLAVTGTIHASTGQIHIYKNGDTTPVLSLTGLDTRVAGSAANLSAIFGNDMNGVTWSGTSGNSSSFDIDDFYADDGGVLQLPDRRVQDLLVTADGGTLNWTPSTGSDHYAVIDESQVSIADYLSASAVSDLDEFTLANLASTPLAIDGVCAVGYGTKTDAASRAVALGIKSGATVNEGPDHYLGSVYGRHESYYLVDPDTGLAWTPAGVNALIPRIKVTV